MRYPLSMISAESVTSYIRQVFPDAVVTVIDKTGTQDHLIVRITSDGFVEKSLLDRHRMVYQALAAPMKDGRIHALEISATTKAESQQ
jgi:stress-induced morphogen